jgi:ATP-dependent DNA helicase RecG
LNKEHFKNLINELRKLNGETEWVEFKCNNYKPELIGEYISALSNSACINEKPYGYLVFGIEDNTHEIIGTQFKPKEYKIGNQELENWLVTQLDPKIDFVIYEHELDGKNIVLFEVGATYNTPVAFKKNFYVRVGSYKKDLNSFPEKARKIWMKILSNTFEDGITKQDISSDDVIRLIDYPKYFELMDLPLPDNKASILEKLREEEVITMSFSGQYDITNLGAILFGKNLKNFGRISRKAVRVIIYKDKTRLFTIKEHEFIKGYALIFEDLIEYVMDKLPSNEVIETALRKDVKMYPMLAIRELIANSLIHQDFTEVGSGPMIEIFEDRIEISNPGQSLISILRLIDHSPQSRNEKLASFMRRMKMCEERGSGIDKVIYSTELFQLPAPYFIAQDNAFKAIMYSYKELKDMNKADKIRACYQHCCLKYVSNDIMTNKTLRERLQIESRNYSMVSRIIADAITEELIKAHDPDNKSKKHMKYIPNWA